MNEQDNRARGLVYRVAIQLEHAVLLATMAPFEDDGNDNPSVGNPFTNRSRQANFHQGLEGNGAVRLTSCLIEDGAPVYLYSALPSLTSRDGSDSSTECSQSQPCNFSQQLPELRQQWRLLSGSYGDPRPTSALLIVDASLSPFSERTETKFSKRSDATATNTEMEKETTDDDVHRFHGHNRDDDDDDIYLRALLCDSYTETPLHLDLSMAELYLIQAVLVDNVREKQHFYNSNGVQNGPYAITANTREGVKAAHSSGFVQHDKNMNETERGSNEEDNSAFEYDSKKYWNNINSMISHVEMCVVRGDFKLRTFMDIEAFPHDPPSMALLRQEDCLRVLKNDPSSLSRCVVHPYYTKRGFDKTRVTDASDYRSAVQIIRPTYDTSNHRYLGNVSKNPNIAKINDLSDEVISCAKAIADIYPEHIALPLCAVGARGVYAYTRHLVRSTHLDRTSDSFGEGTLRGQREDSRERAACSALRVQAIAMADTRLVHASSPSLILTSDSTSAERRESFKPSKASEPFTQSIVSSENREIRSSSFSSSAPQLSSSDIQPEPVVIVFSAGKSSLLEQCYRDIDESYKIVNNIATVGKATGAGGSIGYLSKNPHSGDSFLKTGLEMGKGGETSVHSDYGMSKSQLCPISLAGVRYRLYNTITCEMFEPNINFNDLELPSLLRDYLLCFYSHPGFGNKALDSLYLRKRTASSDFDRSFSKDIRISENDEKAALVDVSLLPNVCNDIRTVLFRPHISLRAKELASPLTSASSATAGSKSHSTNRRRKSTDLEDKDNVNLSDNGDRETVLTSDSDDDLDQKGPKVGSTSGTSSTRTHAGQDVDGSIVRTNQVIVLESDSRVCYRHRGDRMRNAKVDFQSEALAMVLHDQYVSPHVDRGGRGSAGSEDGIRTIIENLNLDYLYHYNDENGHEDIQAHLHPGSASQAQAMESNSKAAARDGADKRGSYDASTSSKSSGNVKANRARFESHESSSSSASNNKQRRGNVAKGIEGGGRCKIFT